MPVVSDGSVLYTTTASYMYVYIVYLNHYEPVKAPLAQLSISYLDCTVSFTCRCDMNSGANDEMNAEDLTGETCCYHILPCSP